MNIDSINWRNDGITRAFIRDHYDELIHPETMKAAALGVACTYCKTIENPYARELMKRSGHIAKYDSTYNQDEEFDIFRKSCRYHGFEVI